MLLSSYHRIFCEWTDCVATPKEPETGKKVLITEMPDYEIQEISGASNYPSDDIYDVSLN